MLKGIDPLLTPELLAGLARMGHGDVLAVVDRNFPAYRCDRVIELPSCGVERVLQAVFSVWPVDTLSTPAVRHMLTDDGVEAPSTARARELWTAAETSPIGEQGVKRLDFYAPAREAMLTLRTGETLPYACYLLTKGVC
ncbi:RbsD/FucU family protein [Acidipropionibacterium timonense]|uniref:RbsD/FucU family protein n=1 Tax=Acidipropionibacterium timonense TaxID=2161818 RepID=UPI0010306DE4|nr:RbsD/FucU domain-containing protein [Acidipropionibacterium timonense]